MIECIDRSINHALFELSKRFNALRNCLRIAVNVFWILALAPHLVDVIQNIAPLPLVFADVSGPPLERIDHSRDRRRILGESLQNAHVAVRGDEHRRGAGVDVLADELAQRIERALLLVLIEMKIVDEEDQVIASGNSRLFGFAYGAIHLVKVADRAPPPAHPQLEIISRQPGDRLSLRIENDCVDLDDIDIDALCGAAELRVRGDCQQKSRNEQPGHSLKLNSTSRVSAGARGRAAQNRLDIFAAPDMPSRARRGHRRPLSASRRR